MRRLLLLVLILFTLVGCSRSGGSKNDRALTIPNAAPTKDSTVPTRTVTAAGATITAEPTATSTATSSASAAPIAPTLTLPPAPTPIPATPTPTPATHLPTVEQLQGALLSLDDMPTGWTTSTGSSDDSSGPFFCGVPPADQFQQTKTSANFQKSQLGPYVTEALGAFADGKSKAWMEALQKRLSCTTWTDTDSSGTKTTYQLAPLSFPKIGDQTFAFRMTVSTSLFNAESDFVFIRAGDVVIEVGNIGVGSVDSDLTATLAQKALDKLQSVHY